MEDVDLYSAQDIENLKQKITAHKEILSKLKTEDSVEDYLLLMNEFNGFKKQVSYLDKIVKTLKGKQSMELAEFKQQVTEISTQIDTLNHTVEELNNDLSSVADKLNSDDSKALAENLHSSTDVHNNPNPPTKEEVVEVRHIRKETIKNAAPPSISSTQNADMQPSFKQLQKLVSLFNVEETDSQNIRQEEPRYVTERNFPANSVTPSQLYNGKQNNVYMKSTISLNHFTNKHTVPINTNRNISNPITITHSISGNIVKDDTGSEYVQTEKEVKEEVIASAHESIPPEVDLSSITNSNPEELNSITEHIVSGQMEVKIDVATTADDSILEENNSIMEHLDSGYVQVEWEEKDDGAATAHDSILPEAHPSSITNGIPKENNSIMELLDSGNVQVDSEEKDDGAATAHDSILPEAHLYSITNSIPEEINSITEHFNSEHAQTALEDEVNSSIRNSIPEENPGTDQSVSGHPLPELEEDEIGIANPNEAIQSDTNPILTHNAIKTTNPATEDFNSEHLVAQEEKEELIVDSEDSIQPESKNKEGMSFLKFFRRKN